MKKGEERVLHYKLCVLSLCGEGCVLGIRGEKGRGRCISQSVFKCGFLILRCLFSFIFYCSVDLLFLIIAISAMQTPPPPPPPTHTHTHTPLPFPPGVTKGTTTIMVLVFSLDILQTVKQNDII